MKSLIKDESGDKVRGENEYRALFDQVPAGIYIHDMEGRIIDVNEEA